MKEFDRNQGVQSESAILVGVELPNRQAGRDNLDELAGLVETAGAEVVGRLTQRRATPDQTTYLGKGKVEQLKLMVRATDADVVIFDNNLAPAQIRNLERELGVKVLDRTEVILDIFSTRARTHEARLAVELAQLEYSLPRLKRMWTHLSRIKAGVGMRGPGEKQLETDRRLVEKRIVELRGELNRILHRKEREVAARNDRMTVSLVGYTNAGKSTLLNKLTGSNVLAEDKLFATLDTRTRRWQLPGWGPVLLSDTVGFIRDLPHGLIASFKATLEEARQADLLLHVADASNPAALGADRGRVPGARRARHPRKGYDPGPQPDRRDRGAGRAGNAQAALSAGHSGQRPHGRGPGAAGRGRERCAVAAFSGRRHRNGRLQRPAAGLPGEARRNPQPHVYRRPRVGPLPDAAEVSRPDSAAGSGHSHAVQWQCEWKRQSHPPTATDGRTATTTNGHASNGSNGHPTALMISCTSISRNSTASRHGHLGRRA